LSLTISKISLCHKSMVYPASCVSATLHILLKVLKRRDDANQILSYSKQNANQSHEQW
jgi:hypothetical protein